MSDLERFRFKSQVEVRNYEIDWQGIVHNANYLLYFEVGRIAYLRHLGVEVDGAAIRGQSNIVIVRNEIDYRSSARFGETLDIYTRIVVIKDSSFTFEGILQESGSGRRVAENRSVHVWLDPRSAEPVRVPDAFRRSDRTFEGNNVAVESPTYFACF
jgi:acyl-CoA thioester hydrolase